MKPNTTYKIIIDHKPSQADNDAVVEGLVVHYERLMGEPRDREFSVFLKNDLGKILGGIHAHFDTESLIAKPKSAKYKSCPSVMMLLKCASKCSNPREFIK